MSYSLRPYQRGGIDSLYHWFRTNPTGHPIVNACVGAGKSIMLAQLCQEAVNGFEGKARLLMITPSKELCEQNMHKLQSLAKNIRFGVISASLGRKDFIHDKDVVIGTIGSLHKRGEKLGYFDLVLIDECHLVSRIENGMYRQLITMLQRHNSNVRVVGWTGTPFRGNGIWLTEGKDRLFTDIAAHIPMTKLLQEGFLSPLVLADATTQVSAESIKTTAGDYVIAELAALLDKDELTATIADEIITHGADRKKWLVYCVTVEHATHISIALTDRGITCQVISAKTPKKEREQIIARFKSGLIRCICNVAVLTTGFDVPEVDMIALVRNTKSPVLYVQIAGRGMRIAPGKDNCLWLDFTDTTARLGPVNQVYGRNEPKKKKEINETTVKTCPECGGACPPSVNNCALCGYVFPPPAININPSLSGAEILLMGKVILPVDEIYCNSAISKKNGKPYLVIKVRSGLTSYSKNLMLGWDGYAGSKAAKDFITLVNRNYIQSDDVEPFPIIDEIETVMRNLESGYIVFKPYTHIEIDFNTPYKDITKFIQEETHVNPGI